MTVQVSPFAAGCGAEISGVDIREELSTADRDAIRKAWLGNLVLRFRGAPMTDAQHMAFTHQFGELEFNPAKLIEKQYGIETAQSGRKSEIPPEISVISNIIEDGKAIGGLGDGEAFWHIAGFVVRRRDAAGREPSALSSNAPAAKAAGGSTYFPQLLLSAYDDFLPARDQKANRRHHDGPCRDAFLGRRRA